jgi:hypothetical protein
MQVLALLPFLFDVPLLSKLFHLRINKFRVGSLHVVQGKGGAELGLQLYC